ncbi:hypothetical protein GCM10027589_33220 [Actinocorallia lasiicapitis]
MFPLINTLIALGMLAVVPLGLTLLDDTAHLRPYWLAGALPGALSLWLPQGPSALLLALPYAAATLLLATHALKRPAAALLTRLRTAATLLLATHALKRPALLARPRTTAALPVSHALSGLGRPAEPGSPRERPELGARRVAVEVAVGTALAMPMVAGVALVAERGGWELFGYDATMLRLTVAHFHFAGFAAALVAALVALHADRPLARLTAWSVPAGTLGVLAGYFVGQWAEFAGAVVLALGMWAAGVISWGTGNRWLRVSGVVLAGSMVLALWYALGEASGLAHPGIGWMAATHGVANALGFGLCGMIGWRTMKESAR